MIQQYRRLHLLRRIHHQNVENLLYCYIIVLNFQCREFNPTVRSKLFETVFILQIKVDLGLTSTTVRLNNVAQITSYIFSTNNEGGKNQYKHNALYLVFDRQGRSLASYTKSGIEFGFSAIVRIFRQVLHGLAYIECDN